MVERVIAACDGAAKGNPGPAGWAYVVADSAGVPQRWQSGALGHSTNNVGEVRHEVARIEWTRRKEGRGVKLSLSAA